MTYLAMFSLGIQSYSSDTDEGGVKSPPKYIGCKKSIDKDTASMDFIVDSEHEIQTYPSGN